LFKGKGGISLRKRKVYIFDEKGEGKEDKVFEGKV